MIIAAFATGVLASLGLGGGMVLIFYLTIFAGYGQLEAQGVNLVFFLPIAATSLILHTKNGLVEWKTALSAIVLGILGAFFGAFLAEHLRAEILAKAFGAFVFLLGIKELFAKVPKNEKVMDLTN